MKENKKSKKIFIVQANKKLTKIVLKKTKIKL